MEKYRIGILGERIITYHLYQFLENENLHYLTHNSSLHGIIGENFFETYEEYKKHITDNNLKVNEI
jgi:hypothetical protein